MWGAITVEFSVGEFIKEVLVVSGDNIEDVCFITTSAKSKCFVNDTGVYLDADRNMFKNYELHKPSRTQALKGILGVMNIDSKYFRQESW